MNTNTAIKTLYQQAMDEFQDAVNGRFPIPESPHASVLQRAHDDRAAFLFGYEAAADKKDAQIADLRTALEAAQQQLARYEAQMLRMAQCAGEFAKDACKVQPDSGRDAAACADPVVETNVALLRSRSALGIEKYGVTLADSKAPLRDWLEHALLEILDCANYMQTAMRKIDAAQQGEHAPAAKVAPDPLRTAVAAFIKARGRLHTEQSYKALVDAYDSVHGAKEQT